MRISQLQLRSTYFPPNLLFCNLSPVFLTKPLFCVLPKVSLRASSIVVVACRTLCVLCIVLRPRSLSRRCGDPAWFFWLVPPVFLGGACPAASFGLSRRCFWAGAGAGYPACPALAWIPLVFLACPADFFEREGDGEIFFVPLRVLRGKSFPCFSNFDSRFSIIGLRPLTPLPCTERSALLRGNFQLLR